MFNHLRSYLLAATLFAAIGFLATAARPIESQQNLVSGLTVTKTSTTSVALSWTGWAGSGNYQVTVLDIASNQVVQQFSTASTSAPVSSLAPGVNYRFSVEKAGYVITEDIIM